MTFSELARISTGLHLSYQKLYQLVISSYLALLIDKNDLTLL